MKLFAGLLVFVSMSWCHAQTSDSVQKIGHADRNYIFSRMPEYKQIERELRTFQTQLQNQLTTKDQELKDKYNAYLVMPQDTPDAIRQDRESELTRLQENLFKFQRDAEASMQKKQGDLVTPVLEKIAKAIDEVAVENGYSLILNPKMPAGDDVLLFAAGREDVSDLVLKKLGIDITGQTPPEQP